MRHRCPDQRHHALALACQDALRPWRHRSWIFPRDPHFARKAGCVIDLYRRRWKGAALGPRDYVLCIDEKTSIQARRRKHPSLPPAPGRPIYVEHEYVRAGALAYLAAWTCIEPDCSAAASAKTVSRRSTASSVRSCREPYRSARRVFLIADNGSCHRGRRAADRLQPDGPASFWFIRRFTPVGSIRSRSTSRSFSASCLPRTISRAWSI